MLYFAIREGYRDLLGEIINILKARDIILGKRAILRDRYLLFPIKEKFDLTILSEVFMSKGYDFNEVVANKNICFFEFEKDELLGKSYKTRKFPSFDIVGDIAIIAGNQSLSLAQEIVKGNKSIRSVYQEKGIHDTNFRIQPLQCIYGEDDPITIHVENNVRLKVDVKNVYFSPRLSTERRRIYSLVKPGERVMVLFSGVGPYVYEIARNTRASYVYGVELNPKAHDLSYENKFLNKAHNALPIYGDVKQVMPEFLGYLFGLKSSIDEEQLSTRLSWGSYSIHELHLFADDVFEANRNIEDISDEKKRVHNIDALIMAINRLKSQHKNVFVHMPIRYKGELFQENELYFEMLFKLGKLAKKYNFYVIVHIHHNSQVSNVLKRLSRFKDWFYYETLIDSMNDFSIFYQHRDLIKNVCFDVSHYSINLIKKMFLDPRLRNQKMGYIENLQELFHKILIESITNFDKYFNLYFHLSDVNFSFDQTSKEFFSKLHKDELEGFSLGRLIDLRRFLPYASFGIVEVHNSNELLANEMLSSYDYLKSFSNKICLFDRILMPLPKSAEEFLDYAIPYVKDKGMIHLYDFVHESDFPEETIRKFDFYAKKYRVSYKIINAVKAGEYAPRKYRVCLDIEILKNQKQS